MKSFIKIIIYSCVILYSISLRAQTETEVRNIILMIGDGMGVAQVYAGYTVNKGFLNLERATAVGFAKTSSANSYITDSGAGATALATGQKTINTFIGLDVSGNYATTILESAEDKGLSTGLVATSSITHATPASFVAHTNSRYDSLGIVKGFLNSGVDIFIGGGRDHFEISRDSINYSDSLKKRGYTIVYDLESINSKDKNKIGCLAASMHLPPVLMGRGDFLSKATNISLSRLSENKKGFFIMIEGSQIDWGGHQNNLSYVTSEMIDFDQAVGEAFDFADQNPGTLVVVTSDHETGGLALTDGDITMGQLSGAFSTGGHTGVMVPVFAYGTGAEEFSGMYENTAIYDKMMHLLRLK
jgi:alkaline phosphatase